MKNLKPIATKLLATLLLSASAQSAQLTIAVDLSGSNPFLKDERASKGAAYYASQHVSQLSTGDSVVLQSFGSLQSFDNFEALQVTLTRKNQKQLVKGIQSKLTTLASQAKEQGSTNLIAYFGRNDFGCEQTGSTVLVLTDGIEASEYVDPNKLLAGEVSLPSPNTFAQDNLKGCTVIFYGLGIGRHDSEMVRLREAWSEYFKQTNSHFKAVIK
ncbi:hypothetical protein [Alteromonas sp. a30]|uniref:hypothetical protein n=1 Tax=Alteromonas sp. a30 TaxID=2730917 RepID=UPI002282C40F|nr:hypothetical protein [Alteromonas sp. a30]MCY7297388.1 hypothetical protein [Alteromonas sp. a30]